MLLCYYCYFAIDTISPIYSVLFAIRCYNIMILVLFCYYCYFAIESSKIAQPLSLKDLTKIAK